MTLYRAADEDRDPTAYGMQVVKASRVDRLRADGWTSCPECGGSCIERPEGCICVQFRDTNGFRIADLACPEHGVYGHVAQPDDYWEPCPSCVAGVVPPDWMIEAAAKAVDPFMVHPLEAYDAARAALLAAAEARPEGET